MNDRTEDPAATRPGMTRWGIWLAMIALVGGFALIMWSNSHRASIANREPPAFSGEAQQFIPSPAPRPAPQAPFSDGDGRTLTLADFRGRVVLVNFWATWCVPCVQEMASLDRLQAAVGDEGIKILAISQDRGGLDAVRPFYDKLSLANLDVYLDPKGTVARAFKVTALPVSVVIDRDGREVGRLTGPAVWDSAAAQTLLRHYLKGR